MYELAQINVARLLAPLDDPVLADFVANLDPVNAAADTADGFVWRFSTDTAVVSGAGRDRPAGAGRGGDQLTVTSWVSASWVGSVR